MFRKTNCYTCQATIRRGDEVAVVGIESITEKADSLGFAFVFKAAAVYRGKPPVAPDVFICARHVIEAYATEKETGTRSFS